MVESVNNINSEEELNEEDLVHDLEPLPIKYNGYEITKIIYYLKELKLIKPRSN